MIPRSERALLLALTMSMATALGCQAAQPGARASARAHAGAGARPSPPTPASPPSDARVEPTRAVVEASAQPPQGGSELAALVPTLTVVAGDQIACGAPQFIATAAWTQADPRGDGCPLQTGDTGQVIGRGGVERRAVGSRESGRVIEPILDPGHEAHLGLVARELAPHPAARLEDRWLARPVAHARALSRWITRETGRALLPVGEVRGVFGDGVDRVAVFRPRRMPTVDDDEEAWERGELAVLVAGEQPRGLLPFGAVAGLQVAGVVDLDGDGVEELLWSVQPMTPTLETDVALSYYDAGEHRVHTLAAYAYGGSNLMVPRARARGRLKFFANGRLQGESVY